MYRPLKAKEYIASKSPISRALNRLGITSSGFKTPNNRNTSTRNENSGIVKSINLTKSIVQKGLRENCRSISPVPLSDDLSQYDITETLGKGAYGLVKLATLKRTGEKFAVKIYEKSRLVDPSKRANVNREISILKRISHSNIISFGKMIENSENVYLFTEFVPGTSLFTYLTKHTGKKISESICKSLFRQVVLAIDYCHNLKIAHRDVKLENILIYNNQIKLIDFGFATVNQAKCRTFCGTPSYMAPELVNRDEYSPFAVDIWALGVLLYAMLCGRFPFAEKVESSLYASIKTGKYEMPAHLSENAKEIISIMLCINVELRPNTAEVLAHQWFNEESIDRSVIRYMVKLGHDPKGIDEAVQDKSSYLSVIYDRLCLKKLRGEVL